VSQENVELLRRVTRIFNVAQGDESLFTPVLASATKFKFGSALGTSVNCVSSTECTVVSPARAAGKVDVKATVNKVSSPKTAADQYTYS
jgi:hypothetical protein